MRFTINLEVAEEGFIKDALKKGYNRAKDWVDKENDKYYKARGITKPEPKTYQKVKINFPNPAAAVEHIFAHPEESKDWPDYRVTVSGVSYSVHFQERVIKEEYKESMIKALTNLPSNLPRVCKEALNAFSSPSALDEVTPPGKPKPVPIPLREIAKINPSLTIGPDKDEKVFIRYYFAMADFFDTVYDRDDEIGIDCTEGKWDNNSSWNWIN